MPSDASHWPAAARYAVLPRAVDDVRASDLDATTRHDNDSIGTPQFLEKVGFSK